MARKLPPLTTLPAFDAAARHLSFTKAAAELNLTHGAISRAMRNLEEMLGIRLFERDTRSVRLTPEGATYAAEIGAALDRVGIATIAATASRSAGVLNVSTSDGFAGRWLVPRLHRFHRVHHEIDVRLSTSGTLTDFIRDGIDIAIRYGEGNYDKVVSELLAEEDVSPVCSPELLKGVRPLRSPEDLRHQRLIHDNFRIDWATWLQAAGLYGIDHTVGIKFGSAAYAVSGGAGRRRASRQERPRLGRPCSGTASAALRPGSEIALELLRRLPGRRAATSEDTRISRLVVR